MKYAVLTHIFYQSKTKSHDTDFFSHKENLMY